MSKFDVIIIGSGLGGLLCGYILSKEGMRVSILEKHDRPGGCLQTFKRKGITFNTGVHYIGSMSEGQVLHRYFKYFGLTDKLKLKELNKDKFNVIAFDDAEYPLAQGFDNFTDQLLPFFPGEKSNLENYTRTLQEISRVFPLYNLELPKNDNTEAIYRGQSAYDFFQRYFHSKGTSRRDAFSLLPAILAGNNFLYAGDPGKTPLHVAALVNHSFISSAWQLADGSDQIAWSLVDGIKSLGGELFTGQEALKITLTENDFNVFTGPGECFSSRYLISGIHPAATLAMTDPSRVRKSFASRISSLGNTVSSFALYIILKERSFRCLDYTLYYHNSFDVWTSTPAAGWPRGYMLYTPASPVNMGFANSLVIMTYMDFSEVEEWTNTGTGQRGGRYIEFKARKADQLLELVEKKFPGLRSGIDFMEISTPLTWRDFTGTPRGSMYGVQKDYHDPVATTILPKTKIPNLFFTGQNINLHGVPGVTIGAVLTCGEIIGLNYLLKKIRNA